MKKTLLLFLFLFAGFVVFGQSDRALALHYPAPKYKVTVFPNPFTNYIRIEDKDDAVKQLVIYNLLGKKMKSYTTNSGESYYVADLPSGFYLVQMLGSQNKIIKTQRIQKR